MTGSSRLAGRTALVTGGNRGIGLAIARAFVSEGAQVLIAARDTEALAAAQQHLLDHGGNVETIQADVANRVDCFDAVARAEEAFGRLDILVNCAALYIPRAFVDYKPSEFSRVLEVDLHGPFHTMQAALPGMISRRYGRIINIASTAGKWASKNQAAYNAAKHGLVGLTRCVALEHAAHGVTVNAICPGLVDTDLTDQFEREHAQLGNSTPAAVHDDLIQRIPMGRFLDASECGHLAVYLASEESGGMTGQSLLLDGGMLFV